MGIFMGYVSFREGTPVGWLIHQKRYRVTHVTLPKFHSSVSENIGLNPNRETKIVVFQPPFFSGENSL